MKKISMTLDTASIQRAIDELKEYQKWYQRKTKELMEAVAIVGAKEAAHWFGTAMYDGNNDVKVEVGPNKNGDGWVISANGHATLFIEFGTGVYHNTGEPHPNRPPGVAGIGEYREDGGPPPSKGARQGWKYKGGAEKAIFTRGNPAAMPMYRATQKMQDDIVKIAREVFSS